MQARRPRGSARQFFTNWREFQAPLARKLYLTLRNRAVAVGLLRGCCGHPGEPGC
ncbi:MAG TPA: hypothetical protein VNO34_11065 [Actinomycetota bacterium]|nr:hypothetical protein [Actinomycetota bacterium]